MKIKTITATEARNNWFEILNWVNANNEEVAITKNNLPVAKIVGIKRYKFRKTYEVALSLRGFLKKNKVYFPSEDKVIKLKEKKYMDRVKLWKIK